jgi:tRNA A-37 threonylcarbamoyl transferase component Bud32
VRGTDPEKSWHRAGELPPGTEIPDPGGSAVLVQDEPKIRIVLSLEPDSQTRQITKIYRTPLALTWRDLFRIPQAQREFDNLQFAFQKGLPVAEPLAYGIGRRPGQDWFSQLTISFLEGDTLWEVLNQPGITEDQTTELLSKACRLIAMMHRAGLVWGTVHFGNFMVNEPAENLLTAFDLPYALCAAKDMRNSRYALFDLWSMERSCRAMYGLDRRVIKELYAAYAEEAGGDPEHWHARVRATEAKKGFIWDRIYMRSVGSFRLRPF